MNSPNYKILQLSKFYPPYWGGIESVTFEITEGVNAHGVKCDVLVANTINSSTEETFEKGYTVWRAANLAKVFSTSIAPALIGLLNKVKDNYDVIHVHFPDPLTAFAIFLVQPKAKIVVHWHSDIIKQSFLLKFYLPLQNTLLRRASLVIGTSPKYIAESKQLKNFLYKTIAIPLGSTINIAACDEKEISLKKQFEGKTILFALGRLVYYKGFEFLIEAAALLPDKYIVLIGGQGPLEVKLENEIVAKGLQQKVLLVGKISHEDLAAYFKVCRIFCFPSTHASEAFGVSQIEAMSFAKPVVATEIPNSGVSWVNEHNVSGLNVPICNATKLAEAILKIDSDQVLYNKLSEGALLRYQSLFTPEKMVASVMDAYESLVHPKSIFGKLNNEQPKVTIITVLLNNRKYIKDAIESVLNQTYSNIEYIIIDGESKDGSVEIIQSYLNRIAVFISEKDGGMYDALNKGIARATGDIIGLLNSDDFFENSQVIENIVKAFNENQCDAIYGDLHYINHHQRSEVVRVWNAGAYSPEKFFNGWMPPHPTFYVKKEVYRKFGAFNTNLKFAADYELMLRFILKHRISIVYIQKYMVRMRVGGASNRNLSNRIKANIEDRKAWKIVGIKPGIFTLILKPLKKIFQYRLFNRTYESN